MDLKFTFGGASPDHHDHGDAPPGIPLPFSTVPAGSTSGSLELRLRLKPAGAGTAPPESGDTDAAGDIVAAEVVTGDGVVYCEAEVPVRGEGSAALARAARSAASRAVAALEGPLADSVTAVVLGLGGAEPAVLGEFDITVDEGADPAAAVDEGLQRRIGVAAGTPIRFGR